MNRRGAILFVAMGVLWGIPYSLIKVAVRDLDPATLVFARTLLGSVLLVPLAAARGQLGPALARWRPLLLYTVCELAVPWVLLSTAEKRLPSSLSGLLVAAVPLLGALMAWRVGGHDPLGARGVAGLVVGLGGVAVLVGFDVSLSDRGAVAMVGAVVVGYALGPLILSRYLSDLPGLGVIAASLGLCAIGYAPYALLHLPTTVPSGHVIGAVVVLGVVCTAVAFVLFFALIAAVGPVRATLITYVNPAVAALLGVGFLGESFGVAAGAGFALILVGSVLAARRPGRPAAGGPGAAGTMEVVRPRPPREHEEVGGMQQQDAEPPSTNR